MVIIQRGQQRINAFKDTFVQPTIVPWLWGWTGSRIRARVEHFSPQLSSGGSHTPHSLLVVSTRSTPSCAGLLGAAISWNVDAHTEAELREHCLSSTVSSGAGGGCGAIPVPSSALRASLGPFGSAVQVGISARCSLGLFQLFGSDRQCLLKELGFYMCFLVEYLNLAS